MKTLHLPFSGVTKQVKTSRSQEDTEQQTGPLSTMLIHSYLQKLQHIQLK